MARRSMRQTDFSKFNEQMAAHVRDEHFLTLAHETERALAAKIEAQEWDLWEKKGTVQSPKERLSELDPPPQ